MKRTHSQIRNCILFRQFLIPEGNCQLPDQNYAADQTAKDKVMYTNTDLIGVEIGAALKNVMALAAGMSDGLGFGDNTKAALMTRGMAEMKRLGMAMGGKAETFAGLSGIGDLIVTCTSMHSRNRRAGILLGQGKSLQETLDEVKMVVEGVNTVQAACQLAEKYHVSMPITQSIYAVLFEGKNVEDAVLELMTRDNKAE